MDETQINVDNTQVNVDKSQAMKDAVRETRAKNIKQRIKNIVLVPWKWMCRAGRAIWNWAQNIGVIGAINLILLIIAIILFLVLFSNLVRHGKSVVNNAPKVDACETVITNPVKQMKEVEIQVEKPKTVKQVKQKKNKVKHDTRKVINRDANTALPIKDNSSTKIKIKIKTVGVAKPQIIKELSVPAEKQPKQVLSGDVIVDAYPSSPVLSNGVKINGNLFIQNVRKYTIPCDTKINGHLFIRNVDKLYFCGRFIVNGNVYVNRQSSFGAIPDGAKINGQIIL